MNCEICAKPYNHSDRQPYSLSCPHTFCLHCVNHLKKSACPNCNVAITIKNQNLGLLNVIPLSKEENLRPQIEKAMDEIDALSKEFILKSNLLKDKLDKIDLNSYNSESLKTEIINRIEKLKDFNTRDIKDRLSHSEPVETFEELIDEAKTLRKEKKFKAAIICLDKAINMNPNKPFLYIEKGDLFNDLNDVEKEIECYDKAIKLNSREAAYHFKKGEALKDLERLHEALRCFEEAIKLDPNNSDYFLIKGQTLRDLNKHKEALISLNQAIKLEPNDHEIYYAKALTLIDLKKKNEAILAFKKAIEIKEDFVDAHIEIAYLLDKMCEEPEALTHYNRALELSPNHSSVYNNKGLMFFNQKNADNYQAIECFDKAISISPREGEFFYNKAFASFYIGRFDCVIECVNKSMELGLTNSAAYDLKGMALKNLNRYDEAIVELDKALKIEPNKKEYLRNKQSILIEKEKSLARNLIEDKEPGAKRLKRNN